MPLPSFNPAIVSNAPGMFRVSSQGYVQGTALDAPAIRNSLVSGIVDPTYAGVMWGGMAITDKLTSAGVESSAIGSVLNPAANQAGITGFTVADQANAMIQLPGVSPVPIASPSAQINFYRLGSGARIVVKCSQAVAAALAGANSNVPLYWDYTNQQLLNAAGGAQLVGVKLLDVDKDGNSMTIGYDSGTGYATWSQNGYVAVIQI